MYYLLLNIKFIIIYSKKDKLFQTRVTIHCLFEKKESFGSIQSTIYSCKILNK